MNMAGWGEEGDGEDWGWGGLQGCVCRLVVKIRRKRGSWDQSAAQWYGGGVGVGWGRGEAQTIYYV